MKPLPPDPVPARRQGGVALITVLVVVAIATVLCVGMLRSQQQALLHAAGLFQQDQAWLYTQGAEDMVRVLLEEDRKEDKRGNREVDHPGEAWAKPFPPYPVEGGMIRARVSDLQGRFNLNRLGNAEDAGAAAVFRQLLRNLALPDNLGPAVTDWIDSDNEPLGSDGAEEDFYSRLAQPYRVANQPFGDISELLLIKGFTPAIVAKLRPHVSALPAAATLNVNTASATVLSALSETLSPSAAAEILAQRPAKGYATVDEFLGQPVFNGMDTAEKDRLRQLLSVKSQYFELVADAEIGGRHAIVHAVLARGDSGTLRVTARDFSRKVLAAASAPAGSGAGEQGTANTDQESPR
ncbi:MAG: ral secretion pathway protein [Moraxellaceae bacterium]|jgi:general secretion pathway protein K|nr:ral secretion pathway protein [Moraxellaceae bacterium]